MENILDSFGVPEDVIAQIRFESFKKFSGKKLEQKKSHFENKDPTVIQLPKTFHRLVHDQDDVWSLIAEEYLHDRGIDIDDYKFYISKVHNKTDRWSHRLIIPIYNKDGNVIFFQGRDLTDKKKSKYLSVDSVAKGSVIYGLDRLHTDVDRPLFVTEGFFDAFFLDGAAVFGNTMTEQQITFLSSSPRKKIVVPDRRGNGRMLALQGLQQKWDVSVIPWDDCKDVNDAVKRFGKLFVIKTLFDGVVSGFTAEVHINVMCERNNKKNS